MIGIGSESRIHASKHASLQLKSWEQILSLRISLQKVLESANKIPTTDTNNEFISNESSELLESLSVNLYKMLEVSTGIESSYDESEGPIRWEQIDDLQFTSQEHWRDVLNKWHSRLQFGSKEAVSRMKTFKQTFYEQVDAALADNQRVIEKSRATWNESPRLLKDESIQENSSYDIEVYEDRQFYSLLLKVTVNTQLTCNTLIYFSSLSFLLSIFVVIY